MMCLRKKSKAITHGGGVQNKFIKIKEELNKKDRGKQLKNKRVIVRGKKNFDEDEQKKERFLVKKKNFDEDEQKKERFLVKKIDENKDGAKRKRVEDKRVIAKKKINFDEEELKKERFLVKKVKTIGDYDQSLPCLPEELVVDNILTRSSGRTLAICSCVSKLWNNSIYNDTRFATSHYIHNQNKLNLFFSLLKPVDASDDEKNAYIFGLETEKPDSYVFRFRTYAKLIGSGTTELVGYANGLACVKLGNEEAVSAVVVINPTRGERLGLYYRNPSEFIPLCHGYGFDSLSQEYKVVVIIKKAMSPEITCRVFTLGTNSWRNITTTVAEISPSPGTHALHSGAVIRISRNFCTSATLCGGDLIWRITANREEDIYNDNVKMEMLLSFDLHNEKLQFHRLPAESTLSPTNENEYVVVDHHLLEFKGYPCIAQFEKIMISNSNHRCLSVFCSSCCCCKVHMYILKDKEKWIKEETFDVQIKDHKGLLPDTFRCYTAITLPTRLLTSSDQVLLYWFDGDCLVFYNLQAKHLKVVKGTPATHGIQDDDNMYCSYMDYQLHAQVENFQSLKTFIPVENSFKFKCVDDYYLFITNKHEVGSLITGREYITFYGFF